MNKGLTALLLAAAGVLAGTGCSDESPTAPLDTAVPAASVMAVTVADAGSSIFRTMSLSLDGPSAVEVEYWTEHAPRLRITSEADMSTHELFVPRLRAASVYEFEVTPISSTGRTGTVFQGSFETDLLPPELAAFQLRVIGTATFPLLMFGQRAIMIDTDGHIVWYRLDAGKLSQGFTRLANGNFVFNGGESRAGLEVVTPTNEVVATLTEADAATRTGQASFPMHHDVIVTPLNTVLFLVRAGTVTVRDTTWVGDEIWEWDPASDDLAKRWAASDFLSPETDRGVDSRPNDWLHANSLSIGPRGNILVSFYWLHEVVSIAADYQSIEWRLGGPASTFAVADNAMEAGQHTAAEVSSNRVLLFDNGWSRVNGELFSRALEIELDQVTGVAEIVWEFRPEPDIYAPIVSSARRLQNGNTVVGFGTVPGVRDPPSTGPVAAFEVTPHNRVLWQVVVAEGVERFLYRFTPIDQIAGEVEVSTALAAKNEN